MYILFTNWGRIGDQGQYQQTPFPTRNEAVKEFKKIFRAKTGNQWKEVNFFEDHDNKYRLVPKEATRRGPELKKLEIDLKECNKPSKLPQGVQDLMSNLVGIGHTMIVTARKRRLRRLCFHSCLSVHGEGGLHQGGWGWADTPYHHLILRDMVNERAVHTLLECILVIDMYDN